MSCCMCKFDKMEQCDTLVCNTAEGEWYRCPKCGHVSLKITKRL